MNITPELLIAFSGLLTGLGAFVKSFWDARQNAIKMKQEIALRNAEIKKADRRDEITLLREEVERLHTQIVEMQESTRKRELELNKRIDETEAENDKLKKRVALLEATLIRHGVDIPQDSAPAPSVA